MENNKDTNFNELMKQMYDVISKQNENSMDSYDFSFYQERRYRISEKLEEILSESKKLALHLQRRMYKSLPNESVQWMDESINLIHDWDAPLHKKYLRKAERILMRTDYKTAIAFIDTIFG